MEKLFSYLLQGDELWIQSDVLEIFLDIISIDETLPIFRFHPSKNLERNFIKNGFNFTISKFLSVFPVERRIRKLNSWFLCGLGSLFEPKIRFEVIFLGLKV